MIKNNSIMKCCICNNEKMGEFITINDKKYHLCCIEQLKKQKDDVVEYIKSLHIFSVRSNGKTLFAKILNKILRMLGEIE